MWLAIKTFFGGLPAWVIPAIGGAVALLAVVWGIYHAGEASARAVAAEQLASDNAAIVIQERNAHAKSEKAFQDSFAAQRTIQAENATLKDQIHAVAQGNVSPGCKRAVLGLLRSPSAAPRPAVVSDH